MPVNVNTVRNKSTGVVFPEIMNTLTALAAKTIQFIGTCHSGSIMGKRRAAADINAVVNELASADNGVVVFASSTSMQCSFEDTNRVKGAFTKMLMEGLAGKAVYTGKKITVNMLVIYTCPNGSRS